MRRLAWALAEAATFVFFVGAGFLLVIALT